ncbi:unnamed protein product [Candidula unifasciata]|uniref:Uncharacterized protein n=1 Tax=Candidula unifasciata TaxID=100452 RepID=A0A8S3ZDE9_9EUPU|nr:unnamed protein product [Candidula unifasciata]
MAFSSVNLLTIQQVDSARLDLVRQAVRDLYRVNIVESECDPVEGNNGKGTLAASSVLLADSNTKPDNGSSASSDNKYEKRVLSSPRPVRPPASTKKEIQSVMLRFEGNVSVEEIEKAQVNNTYILLIT